MKNIFIIFLALPSICLSQLSSGIYQIKLVSTQKVFENYTEAQTTELRLNPSCENPAATNCKKQLWELKVIKY